MNEKRKTKDELIHELAKMHQRITQLEALETKGKPVKEASSSDEEKYRILVDESPLGVSMIGRDGHYKYINPKFTEIFGYTLKDIPTGREWFEKAYPNKEYRNRVMSKWKNDLKKSKRGEARPRTFTVRCKDGSEKVIHFRPVTMDTGDQFVIYEDITERRKAEEALKESEEKLRNILASSPDAITVTDLEGTITECNQATLDVLGFPSKQEIIGKSSLEFIAPEDHRKALDNMQKTLKQGFVKNVEYTCLTKDGSRFPAELSASVILDPASRPTSFIAISKDITDRKKAEREAKRTLKKLRRVLGATVQAMVLTVEIRDVYTAGHQRRVTNLARSIAKELDLSEDQINGIRMAGSIHDIGKIGVPAEILNKPVRLAHMEFELIKTHPVIGYNILKEIQFPWPVAKIVLQHHERMNGSGYPHGLSGDAILIEARILGVADVVEALSSHRPFRPAPGIDKALEQVRENRGTLYDPQVVDACTELFTEKGFKFE